MSPTAKSCGGGCCESDENDTLNRTAALMPKSKSAGCCSSTATTSYSASSLDPGVHTSNPDIQTSNPDVDSYCASNSKSNMNEKPSCCSEGSSHRSLPPLTLPTISYDTPTSSAASTPTSADFPPTRALLSAPGVSPVSSTDPLLPTGAKSAQPRSLPSRWYAAMCNATRRLVGHVHSHGHDKHSHGVANCHAGAGHHHEYGPVCEHEPKHGHGHSHDHAHHHHGDHGHSHDGHDHDHDDDDLVLSLDPDDEALSTPGRHRVTFSVLGMDCPSCSPRVVRALTSMPSVGECHVDVFAGRATVTYHPDFVLTGEMTKRVTAETGFKCQVVEDGLVGESEEPKRRMKIQLARATGEKYPEVDGVKVVREESGLIEVEYDTELNPRDVLALFDPWGATYVPPSQESSTDSAQREVLRLLHLTTVSAILCFPC